jgi:hypothetical protein
VASLVEGSSLLDDKAMPVDGEVESETVGQTSAENSLARALGSPRRPPPAVASAHDDSPTQRADFGPDPTMEALEITGA